MEERPYDHANYMDYLRWYRRSTRIRLCTPRISNGHQDGASGRSAIADDEDSLRASKLRYTPRAHLIHSVVRYSTCKMCFFFLMTRMLLSNAEIQIIFFCIHMNISDASMFHPRPTNSLFWRRRQLHKRAAPEANVMLSLSESLGRA